MTVPAWSGPLGDALALVIDHRGKTPKKLGGDWTESGVPVLSAMHVKGGRVDAADARCISEEMYERWMPERLCAGDVLLTSEAPLGEAAYLRDEIAACLGQRLFALRADEEVLHSRFLYFLLRDPTMQAKLAAHATGTTVLGIRQSALVKVEVDLPDVEYQRQVASVLGSYDDLIENNRRRIEILEEMARLIYREWFVHFRFPGQEKVELVESDLGPIPESWEVRPLSEVLALAYGRALKADDRRGGDVAVYGSGGIVGWHDEVLVDGPGVVVGRKGNVGAVYWSDCDFYPIDTTYFVKTEFPLSFVYQQLRTLEFIDSHAAVPGLSREQAYALKVVLPGDEVLDRFDEIVTPMYELRRNLLSQVTVLKRARDLLVPRLIAGELDVSNLELDLEPVA